MSGAFLCEIPRPHIFEMDDHKRVECIVFPHVNYDKIPVGSGSLKV